MLRLIYRIFFILFLLSVPLTSLGQYQRADSLKQLLQTVQDDTVRSQLVLQMVHTLFGKPRIKDYTADICRVAKASNNAVANCVCVDLQGILARDSSNYKVAIDYHSRALEQARKIGNHYLIATSLNNLGVVYRRLDDYQQGLDYHLQALTLANNSHDQDNQIYAFSGLGTTYRHLNNQEEALKYFELGLAMERKNKDPLGEVISLTNIARIYQERKQYTKALAYVREALPIHEREKNDKGIAICLGVIADSYRYEKNYAEALVYAKRVLEIDLKLRDKRYISRDYVTVGQIYTLQGKYAQGLEMIRRGLDIALEISSKSRVQEAYAQLSETHRKMGDFEHALDAYQKSIIYKDSILNEENQKNIHKMQTRFDSEKREAHIKLLENQQVADNAKLQKQQLVALALSAVLGSVVVVALVLLRNNRRKQDTNAHLLKLNTEISLQKEEIEAHRDSINEQHRALEVKNIEIEKKNLSITASINYARRIQKAMLPLGERINRALPEHFIFFKPRDIVSGDFYWFTEKNLVRNAEAEPQLAGLHAPEVRREMQQGLHAPSQYSDAIRDLKSALPPMVHLNSKVILAAVDCTGHGVPGAFMSMIGDGLLNQIINERFITAPDKVLTEMHRGLRKVFHQPEGETTVRDGMDMALCIIDRENNTLEYAGAKNPLLIIQDGKMIEVKGDKHPIGGQELEKHRSFTRHVFDISVPTTFYIFTDGFQDQFGGPENKKFMIRRLKQLLFEIHHKPMQEQKHILYHTFMDWKGAEKQVDDVLVIGVKI